MTIHCVPHNICRLHATCQINKTNLIKYAEAFTPISLVNEMLDKLPKELFSNKNLKWLEPSAGNGVFITALIERLNIGLSKEFPIHEERMQHIYNMIYAVEINETNFNILKQLGIIHLFHNDYLFQFFDFKFDVIIGNPPFSSVYGKGSRNKLYEQITNKCISELKYGGYMCFITPINIFKGIRSPAYKTIVSNTYVQTINLSTYITKSFKGVQQSMCYFILINQTNQTNPLLTNIMHNNTCFETLLKPCFVNPINNWTSETEALINKFVCNERNNLIYSRKLLSDGVTSDKSFTYILSNKQFVQSNNIPKYLGIPKMIVFGMRPDIEYFHDENGIYGLGMNTYSLFNPSKEFVKFIQSEEFKKLCFACRTTRQYLNSTMLLHLNYLF